MPFDPENEGWTNAKQLSVSQAYSKPSEEVLLKAMKHLASRESWKIDELPAWITEEILMALGERGYLDVRVWKRLLGGAGLN